MKLKRWAVGFYRNSYRYNPLTDKTTPTYAAILASFSPYEVRRFWTRDQAVAIADTFNEDQKPEKSALVHDRWKRR